MYAPHGLDLLEKLQVDPLPDEMLQEDLERAFYGDGVPTDPHDRSQLLSPRIDYVFKRIFGSDDRGQEGLALRGLLSATLELPPEALVDLQIRNGELSGDAAGDKTIRLDLLVRLADGSRINIEMQMHGLGLETQARRICFYLCRLFTMDVPAGFDYKNLRPAVSIVYTDGIHFPDDSVALHVFRMRSLDPAAEELTDALEVRIVELRKCVLPDADSTDDPLMLWLGFLQFADRKGVSDMLARKDPALAQAVHRLREISQDEKERIRAFEREKDLLWDAMNRYNKEQQAKRIEAKALARGIEVGKAEGIEAGKAEGIEVGKAEGIEEGKAEGIEVSKAEGQAEEFRRIAPNLLKKGRSVQEVADVMDCPISEVEKIVTKPRH